MRLLILIFGIICITAGATPYTPIKYPKVPLRIHDIYHVDCTTGTCAEVDREFNK